MENINMETKSTTNLQQVLGYSRAETDTLISMYTDYMRLEQQIKEYKAPAPSLFTHRPGKISSTDPVSLNQLKREQQNLGETMKFQNPLIWMMYKYEAYKDNPVGVEGISSPILTLSSLREHMLKDKICKKRFHLINTALRQKNQGEDLNDDRFLTADTDLGNVIGDQRFLNLSMDPVFMAEWSKNENDEDGKWVNYKLG